MAEGTETTIETATKNATIQLSDGSFVISKQKYSTVKARFEKGAPGELVEILMDSDKRVLLNPVSIVRIVEN